MQLGCSSTWTLKIGYIPARQTAFQQRVKYFDALCRLSDRLGLKSAVREALNATFGNLLELLQGLLTLARQESTEGFSYQAIRQKLRDHAEAELGDVKLHQAMISLLRSQSMPEGAPIRDYYQISWHNYSHEGWPCQMAVARIVVR
jgi:hypothetical protein